MYNFMGSILSIRRRILSIRRRILSIRSIFGGRAF